MGTDRREFIKNVAITGMGITIAPMMACSSPQKIDQNGDLFIQAPLGYGFDALAPQIDAKTMEIHYTKHHAGYVAKLNSAIKEHAFKGKTLEDILNNVDSSVENEALLNNAGGHYNHTLFWDILTPGGSATPSGLLSEAINRSISDYREELKKAALSVFGSGWAWIIVKNDGKLMITSTQNQENPLMGKVVKEKGTPILGLDVWEHAYYLHYQNKRGDYLDNLISIINWDRVAIRYNNALKAMK